MSNLRELKEAILRTLAPASRTVKPKAHKMNLIGREFQRGELEVILHITFSPEDRTLAAKAFDELKRDGYIQPTYDDLVDPENWVVITDSGLEFLRRELKDNINLELEKIGLHLVDLRRGMWDAIARTSPDAPRQAAHSARELIDQVLKEGVSIPGATRKERFLHLMNAGDRIKNTSKSDLRILEASWKLIEAEHDALLKNSHFRGYPDIRAVRSSVEAAERILCIIFK